MCCTMGIDDRVWANRTLTFCNSALDYFYKMVALSMEILLSPDCINNTKSLPRLYL